MWLKLSSRRSNYLHSKKELGDNVEGQYALLTIEVHSHSNYSSWIIVREIHALCFIYLSIFTVIFGLYNINLTQNM